MKSDEIVNELPRGDVLPATRLSEGIDAFVRRVGEAASWLWLGLLAVIVLNVTMRHLFGAGRIEFEEMQWHLYAVGFLVGLAYCLQNDSHIRVDFLRERFAPRIRIWIELYGLLLLLLPFIALVLISSIPFVVESYAAGEVSPSPGGLPLRWLIKASLPLAFLLLGLAAVSRLLRVTCLLFAAPRPLERAADD